MKRHLENSYDYSQQKAFVAIDDWNYGWIDKSNLKRFLKITGHITTNSELIAILRRFDMDGDAKINFREFQMGIKSSLTIFPNKTPQKKHRPRSGVRLHK
jgi:Ca2+-binding EF-hand superfamily protein